MMGPTHRVFGALCGSGVAAATGQPWALVAMTGLVASATSHGWSSPDMDQTGPWRHAGKVAPGPLAKLFTHRYGLSHWWGVPAAAWWATLTYLPAEAQWPATALIVGWVSHLLGDLLFGQLALTPWGAWKVGLGLDTDGFVESGKARIFGKERTVIPFGPARVAITLALLWVLASSAPWWDTARETMEAR